MPSLLLALLDFIVATIRTMGYVGLFALMALEGIVTPIPSELVVPFAGYLAAQGQLDLVLVILVSTAGATLGSTVAYYIGYYAGRPLIERYGRFIGLGEDELRWAEAWFDKYGDWGNLIGHAIPGVRSFISFPAGIAKMDVRRYVLFTALGSAIWNTVLAVAGFLLLDRWIAVAEATDRIDLYVLVASLGIVVGYIWWRKRTRPVREPALSVGSPRGIVQPRDRHGGGSSLRENPSTSYVPEEGEGRG